MDVVHRRAYVLRAYMLIAFSKRGAMNTDITSIPRLAIDGLQDGIAAI